MRAHLLSSVSTPLIASLALLVAACSPSGETSTAESTASDAAAEASAAAPEPAPTEVAAAEPAAAEAPPAEPPAAEPAPTVEAAAAPANEELEAALAAVELRQAPMKLLSWNMGPMFGMLRGSAPFDTAVVQTNTARIAAVAPMIAGVYETDVRSFDVETRALPSIWDDKAAFDAKAQALVEAASAAATTAATGDEAATKTALQAIGAACGSCHDDFRAEAS